MTITIPMTSKMFQIDATIPSTYINNGNKKKTPINRIIHPMHPSVSFVLLPLFPLAITNTKKSPMRSKGMAIFKESPICSPSGKPKTSKLLW